MQDDSGECLWGDLGISDEDLVSLKSVKTWEEHSFGNET